MDSIYRALEMARRERDEGPAQKTAASVPAVAAGHHSLRSRRQAVSPTVLRKNRIIAGMANGPIVDAYRLLRTRVLETMTRHGWTVLGVTSAGGQEGKSVTAANLAISMAREPGTAVLLMDADLRRPSLHQSFGLTVDAGLSDYLASSLVADDILFDIGIQGLRILPGGSTAGAPPELLGSPKMATLFSNFKSQRGRRYVVVDLPPVLVGGDVLALSPHLDAVLLVVDEGRTRADELNQTTELLGGFNVIGSVLNRSPDLRPSSRYYEVPAPRV